MAHKSAYSYVNIIQAEGQGKLKKWAFNQISIEIPSCRFLAHLAYMPMSLCNHDLSVVCHCPLLVLSLSASLVSSSVYSCPTDSIAHRNFISCRYMYIYS